ncbi:MAG: SAM-dependent methyltransferase [Comamonadaceae bacterium]|nr:SAM-dependent methyltransferase [Comamonadaceae bacterium]
MFGALPASGSDFVTAPELSPLFGARAGARRCAQALDAAGTRRGLGVRRRHRARWPRSCSRRWATGCAATTIVDLSGALRARQRERLARLRRRACSWLDALPDAHATAWCVGNEVLDAMPVQLLHWDGARWFERGVVAGDGGAASPGPTGRPRCARRSMAGFVPGTVDRDPPAGRGLRRARWPSGCGAARRSSSTTASPSAEYYHPQRRGGTLMCHRAHRADADPLVDVGDKDITAHVDFSGIALAAQDAGLDVLGYTSQARFLLNCGLLGAAARAPTARAIADAQKLRHRARDGRAVQGDRLGRAASTSTPLGFAAGDRTHTL